MFLIMAQQLVKELQGTMSSVKNSDVQLQQNGSLGKVKKV